MARETVIVIGGGLAGLAAGAYLARAGRSVQIVERAGAPGGRAITRCEAGFRLNLGPHALYRKGPGAAVLRELGVAFGGGVPGSSGGFAVRGGRLHTLPAGALSLLSTGLLRLPEKLEAARLLTALPRSDAAAHDGVSVDAWLEETLRRPAVRDLARALVRLATYAADAKRLSAGAAIRQLQMALDGNVVYLDDGWQTLVDGLLARAREHGAELRVGSRAEAIEHEGGRVRAVRLADGRALRADAVVFAGSPSGLARILPGHAGAQKIASRALPVRAACLDVALSRLPRPGRSFALGIDEPLYLSVHTSVARLAPEGGAVVHAARYLDSDTDPDAATTRARLEALLDDVQPGWRDHVAVTRFAPRLVVTRWLPRVGAGLRGRPAVAVGTPRGLYLAGDWVGDRGLLADAGLASARAAASAVLADTGERREAA